MDAPEGLAATLVDADGRELARLEVDTREPGYVAGNFTPTDNFAAVKPIFDEFEEAVNACCLTHVDMLDKQILAMGIRLKWNNESSPVPIHDLQIYPSEGGFSCRPRVPAEVNGSGQATKMTAN